MKLIFETKEAADQFERGEMVMNQLEDLYNSSRWSGGNFIVRHWAEIKALMEPTTDAT